MKRKVRNIFIATTVLALPLALAACSSDDSASDTTSTSEESTDTAEDEASTSTYGVGDTFYSDEPLTFSLLFSDHENYPSRDDWRLWTSIEERTNVTLDVTEVPRVDYVQKRNLLISSGEAPQIIAKMYPGEEEDFVSSGVLLPISEYEYLLPNFTDKVEKWDITDEVNTLVRDNGAGGSLYILPGLHEKLDIDYTFLIRDDRLEELGLEMPETSEEFMDTFKAIKEAYPDDYPISDMNQFNAALQSSAMGYGVEAGWNLQQGDPTLYDPATDEFYFYPTSDGYKDLVTFWSDMYNEGLVDPESFTQTNDLAEQKFASGRSSSLSYNYQGINYFGNIMDGTLGEGNYSITKMPLIQGTAGAKYGGSHLENGIAISDYVKDDENFTELMNFVDWLWYSDEGQYLTRWGVEGETYEMVDGKPTLINGYDYAGVNPDGDKSLQQETGFAGGNFAYGGSWNNFSAVLPDEEVAWRENVHENYEVLPTNPAIALDDFDSEQLSLMSQPLKDYVEQETTKFILGTRDINTEWDDFVSECDVKNAQSLVDLKNKGYEAAKETFDFYQ